MLAAGLALMHRPAYTGNAPILPGTTYPSAARLLIIAAGAGALALALEVIWFRLLILHAPAADTNFAIMLTLFLTGIALGGALAPTLARLGIVWVAAGGSFSVVLGYVLASPAHGAGLPQLVHLRDTPDAACSHILGLPVYPARLGAAREFGQPPTRNRLAYFRKCAGRNIRCGSGGLRPAAATRSRVELVPPGCGLRIVTIAPGPKPFRLEAVWAAALAAAGLLLFPFGRMEAHLAQAAYPYRSLDGSTVVKVIQGPTTTLQILRRERFGETAAWRLLTDSYSMSAIDRDALRYMQLFAWLPLSLHPEPRRALLISYGAGNTAQALLSDRALEQLTVVDVSPEMLSASPILHGLDDPLRDPRVRLVLEDGRHFLLTRREQFDIITGEPPPPMMAGVVNLYTREYFTALAERLAPGGLATYWLPVHQLEPSGARAVIAAFCDAFADCTLWAGSSYHWILMGGRRFDQRPDPTHFARMWQDPAAASRIKASGLEYPAQLGATFLADAVQLRGWSSGTPALMDDHPKRIAAQPTYALVPSEYSQWLIPDAARRNFETSRWIAIALAVRNDSGQPAVLLRPAVPQRDDPARPGPASAAD